MPSPLGRALVIIERAHRGAVEKQFADSLYCTYLFHRDLGGLDLLLRGAAVTYAARAAEPPVLRIGHEDLSTSTDPHAGLRTLIEAGVDVYAEQEALAALRLDREDRLLGSVCRIGASAMAVRWASYRSVLYL